MNTPGLSSEPDEGEGSPAAAAPRQTQSNSASGFRRGSVGKSVAAQVVGQAASSLLGFGIVKAQTAGLGPGDYGVYASAMGFVWAFALVTDLGLSTVTARDIARRPQDAAEIVASNLGLRIALCVGLVPVIWMLSFLFYPQRDASVLRTAILILGCFLVVDAVRQILAAWLIAHVRSDVNALANVVMQISILLLTLVVVWQGYGVLALSGAFVLANLVATGMTWAAVRHHVSLRPRFAVGRWKAILAGSIAVGLMQIASLLYLKIDGVMLSVIDGTDAAGVYNVSYLLISALATIPSFVMTALIPSIVAAGPEQLRAQLRRAMQAIAIVACVLAGFGAVAARDLVLLVSGPAFAAAAAPFAILVVGNVLVALTTVLNYAAVATDRHRPLVLIVASALVINVGLNLVFIPLGGVTGAALATLPSGVWTLVTTLLVLRRHRLASFGMLTSVIRPGVSAVVAAGSALALHRFLTGGWSVVLRLAAEGMAFLVIFAIVLAAVGGLPPEVIRILHRASRAGPKAQPRHRATS